MNISCEIIKDLLPLYHDGVCSDESHAMVEEHLSICDNCRAEFKAMDEELFLSSVPQNMKEAQAVKKLSKKWKKGMIKSLLKGIFFTILTITIIILVLYLFIDVRVVTVPY